MFWFCDRSMYCFVTCFFSRAVLNGICGIVNKLSICLPISQCKRKCVGGSVKTIIITPVYLANRSICNAIENFPLFLHKHHLFIFVHAGRCLRGYGRAPFLHSEHGIRLPNSGSSRTEKIWICRNPTRLPIRLAHILSSGMVILFKQMNNDLSFVVFCFKGHEVAKDFRPYMHELQLKIQKTRTNFDDYSSKLKKRMAEVQKQYLDEPVRNTRGKKEGYLFLLEKSEQFLCDLVGLCCNEIFLCVCVISEAFGTTWTKHFCTYDKETKKFTFLPYNQLTSKTVSIQ